MAEEKDNKEKNLNMADRRKSIKALYSGDDSVRITLGRTPTGSAVTFFSQATLDRIIQQVSSQSANIDDVLRLSNYAYAVEPNYSEIIDYLSNIYYWRYTYLPVAVKKNANPSSYEEVYKLATDVIDGIGLEVTFPMIITKLFKEGVVYLYTIKDTSSKTISTITLPIKYCSPVMVSQYGTGIYQFDVRYFDSFGVQGEQLDNILELFPPELAEGYRSYKNRTGTEKIILDGRYATYIQLNEYNFPQKLAVLRSLFDYNKYRENEVIKSSSELDNIITHKIPTFEDQLLFELPEVKDLHASMSKILSVNPRLKLLTTFGDTEILPVQPKSSVQNETLRKAYEAIYQNSGLNTNLFNGAIKESLEYSLKRDASIIWKYVEQLVNFYNLTINNLFNFKGYQIQISMLPVTHYNEEKTLELFRKNAEYGVGRLELIVASGTKQQHIGAKAELETYLKLEEILKPLSSSHTQSGNPNQETKENNDEETDPNEEEKPVVEKTTTEEE